MLGALLQIVHLKFWDKVPMQHCRVPEAVDLTMLDIQNDPCLYGGTPVVFRDDFQQILPVVIKGGREQVVGTCL